MYTDTTYQFCRNCAECALTTGVGREKRPLLHPIPVRQPFQIWGIDVTELPKTAKGNIYIIVIQDFGLWFPSTRPESQQDC